MHKIAEWIANHKISLLIFLAVLAVYALSFYQRQSSWAYWMETPQEYVVGDVTALTSMDAYYWVKMARELDNGSLGQGKLDPTKGYPDGAPLAIKDRPALLAEMISLAKKFTGSDYYRSGLLLVPLLAGLFVFPLFFYFKRLGFGASAVLGGLIGSFSQSYYDRTALGRVDTDLLNLFFPITAASFILPMSREKSWRANLGLATGAGATMFLFVRWYQQPSFILVFALFLGLYLLFQRVRLKQSLAIVLVFLLMSGPEYVLQILESVRIFVWAYFSPRATGGIAWPKVMNVVAESQNRGVVEKLKMLHGFLPLVYASFGGLLFLYVRRFKQMIPITPVVLIGLWSLVGPDRFVMYLAPFIGVGAGVLIELGLRLVGSKVRVKPLVLTASAVSLMFVLFFATSASTRYSRHPKPVLSADLIRSLLTIKEIVPENSAMFTPFWEYGYPLMEIGDFATYHDGGLQGGIRTTLTSMAMSSSRQKDMVSLISYLEDHGFGQLSSSIRRENLSADQMKEKVFDYPGGFQGENVYVLYFEEMIWKVSSMTYMGRWDFDKRRSDTFDYVELNCFSMSDNVMTCRDGTIDLNRGLMHDRINKTDIPLRAVLWVDNGYVVDHVEYDSKDGYYLQLLMKDGKMNLILVADERLFHTNFNQQYILGNYDRRYFEEVYSDYPEVRLLKLKENPTESLSRHHSP